MDPDRKQQTNLNDEDDNFITEYKQEVIHKPWSKTLKLWLCHNKWLILTRNSV